MDKESFVISKFENSFNGDDGAVVGKWVFSKDLFCEDVVVGVLDINKTKLTYHKH